MHMSTNMRIVATLYALPKQLLPLLDTYLACYMKHIVLCNWSINVFLYLFSPSVSIPQGYIAVLLLLAFWFVVHRKMTRQRAECVGGWMGLCMCGCSNDLHCPPPSLYPLPLYPSIHPLPPLSLPPFLPPCPQQPGRCCFSRGKGSLVSWCYKAGGGAEPLDFSQVLCQPRLWLRGDWGVYVNRSTMHCTLDCVCMGHWGC